MTNNADPDQLASSGANWSGSTLFAKAGYIWVQQDKGLEISHKSKKKKEPLLKIQFLPISFLKNSFISGW